MKRIPFVLLALLLSGVACSDDSEGPKKEGESDPVTLTLSIIGKTRCDGVQNQMRLLEG